MQKTDAELIAEVENQDWFIRNMAKVLHERHQDKSTPELLMLLPELARRLKAANEIIAAAEWKGQRPRPLSEAERQEFGSDD